MAGIPFPRPGPGYLLPVTRPSTILQGNHGAYSHTGPFNQYAWDFRLPEGTPVVAVRGGIVVYARDDSNIGGEDRHLFHDESNTLTIDHLDGTRSFYLHIKKDSIRVRVGEYVVRGEVIAESGHTGWCGTPHLHFTLLNASTMESIPLTFSGYEENGGIPLEGHRVPAAPLPAVPQPAIDAMRRILRGSLAAEKLGAHDIAFWFTTRLPAHKRHDGYFYDRVLTARNDILRRILSTQLETLTRKKAPALDDILVSHRCLELLAGCTGTHLKSRMKALRSALEARPPAVRLQSRSLLGPWTTGLKKECLEDITGAVNAYITALKKAPDPFKPLIRHDLERVIQSRLRAGYRSFNRLAHEARIALSPDRPAIRADVDRTWKTMKMLFSAWADHYPGEREIALMELEDSREQHRAVLKMLGPAKRN